MKHKKSALMQSVIALLLCVSMLVGTTFAWFTDSVVTGINTIAAGNLDVELYHTNAAVKDEKVKPSTDLFLDLQGNPILWEPGVVSYENLRVVNEGSLALAYQMAINTANENFVVDPSGARYGLSQILKVGVVEGGVTATDRAGVVASVEASNWTSLSNFLRNGSLLPEGAGESEKTLGIVIYWEPGEFDNYWNLNNGKTLSEGEELQIDLGISLIATQEQHESDAFGSDYDTTAKAEVFPEFTGGSASATVVPDGNNQVSSPVELTSGQVAAYVPAGVQLAAGTTELSMSVTNMGASGANIVLGENEAIRSLDVHIEGVAANNATPITVTLKEVAPTGLNMGNYKLYHVENGSTNEMTLVDSAADFTAHNQFKYDPATGDVVLHMATFSEVSVVADTTKAWNGGVDHSWYVDKQSPYYIANADQLWSFSQIVGGMAEGIAQDSFNNETVKLVSDINLDDGEESNKSFIFYPIGYNCDDGKYDKTKEKVTTGFYTFEGTFDGQGHTISNLYQNTWEMKGDNEYYAASEQYYRDGMGLFGKVYGGTVKNLTVKNFKSDGEYTTTGVIAAYADSKTDKSAIFENIAIIDCNPRVYNIGNGGIVGCGGWYSKDTATSKPITFMNITVDKTNKISALWGSWDVACGGIMGQYYPNSGCGVSFVNCNMAAQIDVNNDVCANYQYYAYRYAGMMIGSIRQNLPADANGHVYPDMTGITASNCTVNYGDWNDYYYCELVNNSIASYTHDYQFSRLEKVNTLPESAEGTKHYYVKNADGSITCRHFINGELHTHDMSGTETVKGQTVPVEDKTCVYLPFDQLFTGYGWGVTSKGLNDFDGIEIKEVEQNTPEVKFATKFENTDSYLYRVGNLNSVELGTLFKEAEGINPEDISDSGVYVTITDIYNEMETKGSFKANTTDWTKGTIKFEGTGPVKVIIQDYDYCIPTELYLEVIEAKNLMSATGSNGVDVVLLSDVQISAGGVAYYKNCTVYGNGFEYNVVGGVNSSVTNTSTGKKTNYMGIIDLSNATLDNAVVVGEIYDKYGVFVDNEDVTAAVFASGGSVIRDCHISNCSAPVRSNGATIINTTLYGGTVGNLILNADTTILENVTTINYNDGRKANGNLIIGGGILVGPEAADTTKLVINGNFVQNNFVSKSDASQINDSNAKALFDEMFTSAYGTYQFTYAGDTWVNTGIVSMVNTFDESDISGSAKEELGYAGTTCSFAVDVSGFSATYTGYVYTLTKAGNTVNNSGNATTDPTQGKYLPKFELELGEYYNSNDGESDTRYCYESVAEEEIRLLYQDGEKPFEIDLTKLAKVTKFSVPLNIKNAVCKNASGEVLATNSVVTLKDAGIYTIEFTAEDDLIFGVDGIQTGETVDITYVVNVDLAVKKASWKNAEIKLSTPTSNSGYTNSKNYSLDFLPAITITDYKEDGTSEVVSIKDLYYNYSISYVDNATPSAWSGFTLTITLNDGRVLTVLFGASTLSSPGATAGGKTFSLKSDDDLGYYLQSDGTVKTKTSGTWPIIGCSFKGNNTVTVEKTETVNLTVDKSTTIPACVTPDTLVTLADGKQVRVDSLTGEEELLVWNMETGKLDSAPILFVDSEEEFEYEIIHLYFSDGTDVKVISEHGFWDYDLNKYVYLDRYAEKYIGHTFAKQNGCKLSKVTLTNVVLETEVTTAWSPVTAEHLCYFVNGMLSMPGGVGGLFNIFTVDPDTMTYDFEAMQRDIETYGLYTYEELNAICPLSEEMFNMAGGAYLKISIGKGNLTEEELIYMINRYSKFF